MQVQYKQVKSANSIHLNKGVVSTPYQTPRTWSSVHSRGDCEVRTVLRFYIGVRRKGQPASAKGFYAQCPKYERLIVLHRLWSSSA